MLKFHKHLLECKQQKYYREAKQYRQRYDTSALYLSLRYRFKSFTQVCFAIFGSLRSMVLFQWFWVELKCTVCCCYFKHKWTRIYLCGWIEGEKRINVIGRSPRVFNKSLAKKHSYQFERVGTILLSSHSKEKRSKKEKRKTHAQRVFYSWK